MSRTKTDRFEQMVYKENWGNAKDGYFIPPSLVVKLLRLQHRRLIREIKKPSGYVTVKAFRFDLLDRIKAMRFK